MQSTLALCPPNDFIAHYGVKGQKWGFRQYQYSNGALTPLGRLHYGIGATRNSISSAISSGQSFINSLKGKSFNDLKIDTLDYLNRKGVLDFLDSKASDPFSAINEGTRGYVSNSSKDAFAAINNVSRYLDLTDTRDAKFKSVNDQIANLESAREKSRRQSVFGNFLDKYTDRPGDYSEWATGMLSRDEEYAVYDKKLGMLSKDARDIERSTKAKSLVDSLRETGWDINKLDSSSYKTDAFGRKIDDFIGERSTYDTQVVDVPVYKEVTTPAHKEFIENRYAFKYPGDTRSGVKGTALNDTTIYPFVDQGPGKLPMATIPVYMDVPSSTQIVRDGTKKEAQKVWTGYTKEYRDFMEGLDMPSDYSHLTKDYTDTIDLGSNWLNQIRHCDISDDYLAHHGIKGQKWGNRRYQNSDGSLTALGRVHYGVGKAREVVGGAAKALGRATGSGASKVGNSIRKAVKPTDDELLEKYNKARAKQARKDLKEEIRELNGHKKSIRKMSDQEIVDHINRYRNEETLRALAKDAGKSKTRRMLENAAREAVSNATKATLQATLGNVGQHLADTFDTESNKLRREAEMARNREVIENSKKQKSAVDEAVETMKKQAEYDKAKRDSYESQLQEAALRGDETAKQRLSNFTKARSGKHVDIEKDPDAVEVTTDSKVSDIPKPSKPKHEEYVDVVENAQTHEYEEVNDRNTSAGSQFIELYRGH